MRSRIVCLILMPVALFCLAGAALAEDSRVISDKWYVTLGGYLAQLSTDASVGTTAVVGTVIQAEDQLGLDDNKSTFRLLAERRLGQRHTLGFEYLDISRSGNAMIDESIEFDGNVYDIGAELSSKFETELFQLTYRYSFFRNGEDEAGIQTGLSTWNLSAELAGEATVDDGMGGTIQEFARAGEDLLVPIPSIGIYLRHAFTPRLVLAANAKFFRVRVGDVEGRVVDSGISLDYFFSRHVGVGLGLNGTDMRYQDHDDSPINFDYRQNGVIAYASLAF